MEGDRRSSSRTRTLKSGRIIFDRHASVFDCTIQNASEEGALLSVPDTNAIPDEFFLYIDCEHTRRAASVAWRREGRIGIRFIGPVENVIDKTVAQRG